MDNIVNDVKNLFRRAKIFFRASANKILSPKTKIDDDKIIPEPTKAAEPDVDKIQESEPESGYESEVEIETESKAKDDKQLEKA